MKNSQNEIDRVLNTAQSSMLLMDICISVKAGCHECSKFDGMTMTLTDALEKRPLFNKNCRNNNSCNLMISLQPSKDINGNLIRNPNFM